MSLKQVVHEDDGLLFFSLVRDDHAIRECWKPGILSICLRVGIGKLKVA